MYFFSCHFSSLPPTTPSVFMDILGIRQPNNCCVFLSFLDSSLYAHYVFKAFDVNCNGAISFRVIN